MLGSSDVCDVFPNFHTLFSKFKNLWDSVMLRNWHAFANILNPITCVSAWNSGFSNIKITKIKWGLEKVKYLNKKLLFLNAVFTTRMLVKLQSNWKKNLGLYLLLLLKIKDFRKRRYFFYVFCNISTNF